MGRHGRQTAGLPGQDGGFRTGVYRSVVPILPCLSFYRPVYLHCYGEERRRVF